MSGHFFITGSDERTVLHSEDSSNGCVLWAERYVRYGNWGGWDSLMLWEWNAGGNDILLSTFHPGDEDRPNRWEDTT